jgi:hypothetical protein
MSDNPKPTKWMHQAFAAVVTLLAVATGARIVAWLLGPVVPWLMVLVALGVVYLVIFRGLRR